MSQQAASVTTTVSAANTTLMPACVTSAFRAFNEAALTAETLFRTTRKATEGVERIVEASDELATKALAIKQRDLLKQLESA